MEHAYNSGCKRTHSHQIQLDGGESANKTVHILHRASYEREASLTSPAMLFLVARHFGLCVLSQASSVSGRDKEAGNHFRMNACGQRRYQAHENTFLAFGTLLENTLVFLILFSSNLFHRKNIHPAT